VPPFYFCFDRGVLQGQFGAAGRQSEIQAASRPPRSSRSAGRE